jgi:hypothetical protein
LHFDFPTANLPIQSIQPQAPPDLLYSSLSLYSFLPFLSFVFLCSSPLRAFVSSWLQVNYAKQTQFQNG